MKRIVAAASLITWLSVAWPALGDDKPMVVLLSGTKAPKGVAKLKRDD